MPETIGPVDDTEDRLAKAKRRFETLEKREQVWEKNWKAQDFSWEGLKKKSWAAPPGFPSAADPIGVAEAKPQRNSNLQEYWRWSIGIADGWECLLDDDALRDKGLLVEDEGKLWHILHRPQTDTMECEVLKSALRARMERSENAPTPPDPRLQLGGARARHLDQVLCAMYGSGGKRSPLRILAPFSEFTDANFSNITFSDYADFSHARFGDDANFMRTVFGKHVDFSLAIFGENASFKYAIFENNANFENAVYKGGADFTGAVFGSGLFFSEVISRYCIRFNGTSFGDNAQFTGILPGRGISFSRARFGDGACFDCSVFFCNIRPETDRVKTCAYFNDAIFGSSVSFDEAIFTREVNFSNAVLGRKACFTRVYFMGDTDFTDTTFADKCSFYQTSFQARLVFNRTQFAGNIIFKKVKFPSSPQGARAFEGARFQGLADFTQVELSSLAAFDGARFEGGVLLEDDAFHADAHFKQALRQTRDAVAKTKKEKTEKEEADKAYAALEGGCRVLKWEMEKIADWARANRYFRYELIARRHRPSLGKVENIFSYAYGFFSDFGTAIGKPIFYLAASIPVFAAILYWLTAADITFQLAWPIDHRLWDAVTVSIQNITQPFSIWAGRYLTHAPAWLQTVAGEQPLLWLGLRLGATLHTLFAIAMLFLTGVALRRKFRIT